MNCKLTGCRCLSCCRQVEVSNLPVRVYVLSEKDIEQVDDVGITTPLRFFRFIDWWTGINKRTLLYHFLFPCQVAVPSSPPVFILHSLCTSLTSHFIFAVQLPSFCILHLSWDVFLGPVLSVMKWRLVSPPKNIYIQVHGRKKYHIVSSPMMQLQSVTSSACYSNMCE